MVFLIVKAFNKAQNLGSGLTKGLTSKVLGKDGEEIEVEMLPPDLPVLPRGGQGGRDPLPALQPPSFPEPAAPTPKR